MTRTFATGGGGPTLPLNHHTDLTNFTANDDHTQYFLLAGRSGGQTANGGTASGNNLIIKSNPSLDGYTQFDGQIRITAGNPFGGGSIYGESVGGAVQGIAIYPSTATSVTSGLRAILIDPVGVGLTVQDSTYVPLGLISDIHMKSVTDKNFVFGYLYGPNIYVEQSSVENNIGLFAANQSIIANDNETVNGNSAFSSTFGYNSGVGATLNVVRSVAFVDQPTIQGDGTINITTHTGVDSSLNDNPGITITTRRGLWYKDTVNASHGTVVTSAAVDVEDQTVSTLALSLRSVGLAVEMRHAGLIQVGLQGTKTGILQFNGTTSGAVSLTTAASAGTWTLTLPTSGGTNKYLLQTNGSGTTTWSQVDLTAGVTGTLPVANGGTGQTTQKFPSVLFDHFANAGNSTTTETDLYSDTIAAGQLANNGEKIEVEYGGIFVSSATATREIKVYFGGTVIFDTGALTLSLSSAWTCFATIIRVSSSVIRYMFSFTTEGAALAAYTAVGELTGLTLSGTNILKITGQAAGVGAATNDIVAKLGSVSWVNAA